MSLDKAPVFEPARPPPKGQFTLEELHNHLRSAIYVEMSTIPLYLYAYYSIRPYGHGEKARKTIKSVFREEMLHLALACNTLYALGGTPTLYSQIQIPRFPEHILYTDIGLHLRDGRKENIKTFVDVEAPIECPSSQLLDPGIHILETYGSIGEFYEVIKQQLKEHGGSIKQRENQISTDDGFWHDDNLIVVSNVDLATKAMDIIIEQGEGGKCGEGTGSHFDKFDKLWKGPDNWEVYYFPKDPQTVCFQDCEFYKVLLTFDAAYCYLLLNIETLYRVLGDKRTHCSKNIRTIMGFILTPLAEFLRDERFHVNIIDDYEAPGPCFNYYKLDSSHPLQSLKDEIKAAVAKYEHDEQKKPKLEDIQRSINGLNDLPAA